MATFDGVNIRKLIKGWNAIVRNPQYHGHGKYKKY